MNGSCPVLLFKACGGQEPSSQSAGFTSLSLGTERGKTFVFCGGKICTFVSYPHQALGTASTGSCLYHPFIKPETFTQKEVVHQLWICSSQLIQWKEQMMAQGLKILMWSLLASTSRSPSLPSKLSLTGYFVQALVFPVVLRWWDHQAACGCANHWQHNPAGILRGSNNLTIVIWIILFQK